MDRYLAKARNEICSTGEERKRKKNVQAYSSAYPITCNIYAIVKNNICKQ
jgi:hypothetical protein